MPAVLSFKLHYLYFPEYHDKSTYCISLMSSVLSKFHILYFPENPENIHFFCFKQVSTFTVHIFQNIIKRRDISLMSVLLSKFPVISFTYNVLHNIMRVSNHTFLLFQASFKFCCLYFPECNTRSCISLMSAVLSSPVLLKLEGKVGEEMWFKGRSGTGIPAHWAHWAQWLLTSEVRRANAA